MNLRRMHAFLQDGMPEAFTFGKVPIRAPLGGKTGLPLPRARLQAGCAG